MTINDIAALAGVSISTVSKIMNNKADNINALTKERVLNIAKEYNYVPYASIKSASYGKTFLLGVLLTDRLFATRFVEGITQYAQSHGYTLLICNSYGDLQTELRNITALCKNSVDGVIWEPVGEESKKFQRYFEEAEIKVVPINSFLEESYSIDFARLGYQATKELIDRRHSQLACIVNPDSYRSKAVISGFKQCLFENQVPFHDSQLLETGDPHNFTKIVQHNITGILCSHFASSLELYGKLQKMHFQIPYELSLISLKDDSRKPINYPQISNICIPYYAFGVHVCEALIKKCEQADFTFHEFSTPCVLENSYSLDIPYTSRQSKILVVGSINIDIILSVNEIPHIGETVSTTKCSVFAGGKGSNQAVGASRLGHQVSLIGKVGNDTDAEIIYNCMQENGIDSTGIIHDRKSTTGKAYIHVQNDGDSTISIYSGANSLITAKEIVQLERLFEHTGFCLLQTEISTEAIETAAHMAKKHGARTILKPSASQTLSDSLLSSIDILVPNSTELSILCPDQHSLSEQADQILLRGVQIVIVTLGAKGCYLKTHNSEQYFQAANFVAIDNTGASDAFISALASYMLYGYSIEKAIQIASYAAGFCISRQGVTPALIDRNSLEAYISKADHSLLVI